MNRLQRVLLQSHLPMAMMQFEHSVVGEPGVRDTLHPCESFEYGPASGDCWSDGHYMCKECRHLGTNRFQNGECL